MSNYYTNLTTEKKDPHTTLIRGEVPADVFESHREEALKTLGAEVTIPGFRKGHVPADVLVQKIGEGAVLQEMADRALRTAYPAILKEVAVDAIGTPQITITKLAPKNPLGFTITLTTMPEVKLPDYRGVAKKAMTTTESVTVSEKELEEAIEHIRKMSVGHNTKDASADTPKELPVLDDAYVQKLGNFKTVDEFKEQLRTNIKNDKERAAKEASRQKMLEAIIDATDLTLPDIIIENELERLIGELKARIEQFKTNWSDYLKTVKKSEEEIRTEMRPDAEKRAKVEIILNHIAEKEGISADATMLATETKRIMEAHKDAKEEHVRAYVSHILRNEAVLAFLEGGK